ncbi:esterase/lipase family protein [Croceicoccus naphthovorans]|uniref:esterase/lipase family protein n=1 Tax=Croceicoccus naphthovorans TaxID=1348774 RepID=UPI0009E5B872|nr:alpha/beta fold hydrolase [Croceicoccus naphthovorans]MBB3990262.1 pimeloyl-ACP methyl ester carboxylesterase [Croceicoccus naphthovorans]
MQSTTGNINDGADFVPDGKGDRPAATGHASAPREPGRGFSLLFGELARRHQLASRPQPDGVATPKSKLLISEFASLAFPQVYAAMHGPVALPKAEHPRAVMLLPGFGSHPWRMARMRKELEKAGHSVTDWGLGWNLGPTVDRFERLLSRIERVSRAEGRKLVLVGWSLGGLFAREAAKRLPDRVEMVVTMGSPFSGDMHGNNAWRVYHWITGHPVDQPPVGENFAEKPPVTTVALWSAQDGVVHRHCACGRTGERDISISVRCTHMGFAWHPRAIQCVAQVLDTVPASVHEGDGELREGRKTDETGVS